MIENASGIILRVRPLTESSLIVSWLTPQFGRISTVAKGARRPKSPFSGKLDVFYLDDFSFSRSQRSELHNLREVALKDSHPVLRQDLGYLQQAAYCAALIEQTTEAESPIAGMYELFASMLAFLPQVPRQPRTVFAFELKLLAELGLEPDPTQTHLSAGGRELLQSLLRQSWKEISELKPKAPTVAEVRRFLQGFLVYHLSRLPRNRPAAIGHGPESASPAAAIGS
jgi:DNA repair protein RecO (recombination protein O)